MLLNKQAVGKEDIKIPHPNHLIVRISQSRTQIGKKGFRNMDGKLRNMTSLYLSKENKMLLLYRQGSKVVNDVWIGSAGGHFEEFELNDAKACILRELQEELGIKESELQDLRLRYVTLRRTKGELRKNYYFFAGLREDVGEAVTSNEGVCKWFDVSELTSLQMPFTARFVIEHYLREGRNTDMIYAGITDGKKVVFIELPEF